MECIYELFQIKAWDMIIMSPKNLILIIFKNFFYRLFCIEINLKCY